jgi:polyisoprenoid-binding protein YceI
MVKTRLISLLFCASTTLSSAAFAAAPTLTLDPKASYIRMVITQNGAPVEASFTNFDALIAFDPKDLPTSSIKAEIAMDSFTTGYSEVVTSVKQPEWFNIAQFPKAAFFSNSISAKGNNTYEAKGTLTIKGHATPFTLPFTLKEDKPGHYIATSDLELKRSIFAIGEGNWAKSDVIKDEVKVSIMIQAGK